MSPTSQNDTNMKSSTSKCNINNWVIGTTIFAKDFDMNKLLKFLWRGRKQGRCGRSPMLKIEKYQREIPEKFQKFVHIEMLGKRCIKNQH